MYSPENKKKLLTIAQQSINYGLTHKNNITIDVDAYPEELQEQRASFVTLKINNQLRGCIGTLNAYQPLVTDVAKNAYAAAFNDPRFPAVTPTEFSKLHYHISVLSPPQEMSITSEKELLSTLRAGEDGLILNDHAHRATFLPSVWESLSDPQQFVNELKRKAGLPANYWSNTIRFQRYGAESVEMV